MKQTNGGESACDKNNWSIAIQWLNLFLSILIVFLHLDLGNSNSVYVAVKRVMNVLADSAVPAYFIVSAYLSFRSERPVRYLLLLRKKFMTLVVPYLLWNLIGLAYCMSLSALKGETFTFSLADLLLCGYNAPLWFLRVLFGYVILAPAISFIVKRKALAIALMLGLFACNVFVYTFPYDSLTFWLPCYLLGAYSGANHSKSVEAEELVKGIVVKTIVVLLLILVVVCGVMMQESKWFYVYRITSGLLVVLCFLTQQWKRRPVGLLQNSFFTFCSHALLLGVAKIFNRILPDDAICTVLGYILCAGAVWFVTTAIAELLKKYAPKIQLVLVGGRKDIGS